MNTQNNTVLITGGSAGMRFKIAKKLSENGNAVIITGRNKERLEEAASSLTNVTGILCDVTNEADIIKLVEDLKLRFSGINMLINNAGKAFYYDALQGVSWESAKEEMETNYFSIIRLTEMLLPTMLKNHFPCLVNVSSFTAISPGLRALTYSSSKAALHIYTRGIRVAYRNTQLKVFELMPPLVATNFSKEIGGYEKGISATQVANELISALERDEYEIHIGRTADIYKLDKISYDEAIRSLNGIA